MPLYRIFAIDAHGHYISGTTLVCPNDEQAIEQAQGLQGGRNLDIWNGPRFVVTVKRTHSALSLATDSSGEQLCAGRRDRV
jgi:hypothetical protein